MQPLWLKHLPTVRRADHSKTPAADRERQMDDGVKCEQPGGAHRHPCAADSLAEARCLDDARIAAFLVTQDEIDSVLDRR